MNVASSAEAQGGLRIVAEVLFGANVGPRDVADSLGVPLVPRIEDLPDPVDLVSVAVPTVDRLVREALLRTTAIAGGMPSIFSTRGRSIRSMNWRAYGEKVST